ncbi:MAG TPA: hypothetical protein VGF56_00445 [Rhizomicrobium sp.]
MEERDHLIEADPETFYITGHFRNYKGLLAHIGRLDEATFRALLEHRWQAIAPRKLAKDAAAKSVAANRKKPNK